MCQRRLLPSSPVGSDGVGSRQITSPLLAICQRASRDVRCQCLQAPDRTRLPWRLSIWRGTRCTGFTNRRFSYRKELASVRVQEADNLAQLNTTYSLALYRRGVRRRVRETRASLQSSSRRIALEHAEVVVDHAVHVLCFSGCFADFLPVMSWQESSATTSFTASYVGCCPQTSSRPHAMRQLASHGSLLRFVRARSVRASSENGCGRRHFVICRP
jgi:hypothetical protein